VGGVEGYVPEVRVSAYEIESKGSKGSTYIGTPISIARFSAAAIAIRAPSSVSVGCEMVISVHNDSGAIVRGFFFRWSR
jgi:hypothetical protein